MLERFLKRLFPPELKGEWCELVQRREYLYVRDLKGPKEWRKERIFSRYDEAERYFEERQRQWASPAFRADLEAKAKAWDERQKEERRRRKETSTALARESRLLNAMSPEEREEYKRKHRGKAPTTERQREEESRAVFRSLTELQQLSGTEFEKHVARLLTRAGYRVEARGKSGDEGIDLLVWRDDAKDVVQCKRWKNDVGASVIRDFYGALMHVGAKRGLVVTTAGFTFAAQRFALGKPIVLVDGKRLVAWAQTGLPPEG